MKAIYKLLILLLVVSMLATSFVSCKKEEDDDDQTNNQNGEQLPPLVDYVANVKFDPNSGRKYMETTVKYYVDGDTTHFEVPKSFSDTGILKARYLGVNTPESTGEIEPWGKFASTYTRTKLEAATSIIVESNNGNWNPDSTGERYLVWVWYKTAEMTDYRNLNLELLQEGLSKSSSFDDNCYETACRDIFNQAITHKLKIFSSEKDPDFYYGSAISVTLKELKMNINAYKDKRVAFEGVVAKNEDDTTVFVEEYDPETDTYFGMQVFYGYNLNYFGKTILTVGNRVRIAGSVQYYENGGTWQISDIKYDPYDSDSSENIKKISDGHTASYNEIRVPNLLNGTLAFEVTNTDDNGNETVSTKTLDYGYVVLHSTATLKNLTIQSVYTTQTGSSKGAMTLTCIDEYGNTVKVRTAVLTDSETLNQITEEDFPVGSVIDVKGVVDYYENTYQLKLLGYKDVTFH